MNIKRPLAAVILKALLISALFLVIDEPAAAQVNGTGESISWPDQSKSFAYMIVQLIFYTGLIIGLIVLLARFLAKRQQQWGEQATIQHLGGTPLGPNKSVQLLKLGDKVYVLGVAEQITLLDVIDDPEEVKQLEQRREGFEADAFKGRWSALFSRFTGGTRNEVDQVKTGKKGVSTDQQVDFMKVLEKSLKGQQEKQKLYSSMLSAENSTGEPKDENHGQER